MVLSAGAQLCDLASLEFRLLVLASLEFRLLVLASLEFRLLVLASLEFWLLGLASQGVPSTVLAWMEVCVSLALELQQDIRYHPDTFGIFRCNVLQGRMCLCWLGTPPHRL